MIPSSLEYLKMVFQTLLKWWYTLEFNTQQRIMNKQWEVTCQRGKVESSQNVMARGDARVREVKGKIANGLGNQYPSHYLGAWCIQHYYCWWAHLGCQQSTELTPPANLNGLVRFAERRNQVSARVPSYFKHSLLLGAKNLIVKNYFGNVCI